VIKIAASARPDHSLGLFVRVPKILLEDQRSHKGGCQVPMSALRISAKKRKMDFARRVKPPDDGGILVFIIGWENAPSEQIS
jgi:hypothetical protein